MEEASAEELLKAISMGYGIDGADHSREAGRSKRMEEGQGKEALITALSEERRKIQLALREAGYFAYTVKFHEQGKGRVPAIEVTARAWGKGDEKLLDL
jgi:hypothetical protein